MKEKKKAAPNYNRAQLLRFERYKGRRDLLTALLLEERRYTVHEVDGLLRAFMKGAY